MELAHEALLHTWERLVEWIETIADDLRLRDEVERAALRWDNEHRPDYLLWPHERLAPVYAMQQRLTPEFEPFTLDFIKPEAERLLQQFVRRSTPFHRRLTIIDRWREIGLTAQTVIEAALDYADADTYPYLLEMVDLFTAVGDLASGKRARRVDAVDFLCNINDPMAVNALLETNGGQCVAWRRQ